MTKRLINGTYLSANAVDGIQFCDHTIFENDPDITILPPRVFFESLSGLNGNEIIYTSNSGYSGQDTITYMYTDENGQVTVTTVSVTVECNICSQEAVVALSWSPNSESISGYRIYYGPDAANATVLISDVAINSGLIDPTAPHMEYKATSDLNFYPGEQVCFKVQAYTATQASALSQAVCSII